MKNFSFIAVALSFLLSSHGFAADTSPEQWHNDDDYSLTVDLDRGVAEMYDRCSEVFYTLSGWQEDGSKVAAQKVLRQFPNPRETTPIDVSAKRGADGKLEVTIGDDAPIILEPGVSQKSIPCPM